MALDLCCISSLLLHCQDQITVKRIPKVEWLWSTILLFSQTRRKAAAFCPHVIIHTADIGQKEKTDVCLMPQCLLFN